MNTSLLRKLSIGIASLTVSSMAFAAMDMDSRVTQLENQMQQVRTTTPMGTYGAKTATARPEVNGHGWFIDADVLIWHPKIGGTEFCYKTDNPNATAPFEAKFADVDFDWSWGFRVGLGYNFKHDGWSVGLKYTYFNPDDSKNASTKGNQSLVPLKGSVNLPNLQIECSAPTAPNRFNNVVVPAFRAVQCARDEFDIFYNTLDLELARAYYVSKNLSFRPHWGLRSAWIDLEENVLYQGQPECTTATVGNGSSETGCTGLDCNYFAVHSDCDFWGLGPRTGVDSKWYLGNGVSIFGNIAVGLLYGFFDIDRRENTGFITNSLQDTSVSPQLTSENAKLKFEADRHMLVPTLQMFLGLRYDTYMNKNKNHLGIGLGYEVNYWWRVNQMLKVNDFASSNYDRYSEDLGMYGVTLDLRLDF